MEDMEHLKKRWVKIKNIDITEESKWDILTKEEHAWRVMCVSPFLPGDRYGERTADYICKLHNDSLSGE